MPQIVVIISQQLLQALDSRAANDNKPRSFTAATILADALQVPAQDNTWGGVDRFTKSEKENGE